MLPEGGSWCRGRHLFGLEFESVARTADGDCVGAGVRVAGGAGHGGRGAVEGERDGQDSMTSRLRAGAEGVSELCARSRPSVALV